MEHPDTAANVVVSDSFQLSRLLYFAVVITDKGIWYVKAGSKVIDKTRLCNLEEWNGGRAEMAGFAV